MTRAGADHGWGPEPAEIRRRAIIGRALNLLALAIPIIQFYAPKGTGLYFIAPLGLATVLGPMAVAGTGLRDRLVRAISRNLGMKRALPVQITIMQDGVKTGSDHGILFLAGGLLCFRGLRTAFSISNELEEVRITALPSRLGTIEIAWEDRMLPLEVKIETFKCAGEWADRDMFRRSVGDWMSAPKPKGGEILPTSQIQPGLHPDSLKRMRRNLGYSLAALAPAFAALLLLRAWLPAFIVGMAVLVSACLYLFLPLSKESKQIARVHSEKA